MNDLQTQIESEYTKVYTPLVNEFCKEVNAIAEKYPFDEHNRVPAPFLPIIGTGYYEADNIKVAIYGMETLYWHDLSKFVSKFVGAKDNPLAVVKKYTDGNTDGTPNKKHKVQRFHVHHGVEYWKNRKNAFGFWSFAYSALAGIYNKSEKDIRSEKNILQSFIWGNVNAYEKYEATWKKMKVSTNKKKEKKSDWETVFDASKRFNSAQLLLPYARPQIMVVFYKDMSWNWLTKKDDIQHEAEVRKIDWKDFKSEYIDILNDSIHYYYLPETKTYVLHTLHPGRMRYFKGMSAKHWKAAINYAIREMMKK